VYKRTTFAALIAVAVAMPALSAPKARVPEAKARAAALALVKDGTVKSSELEHEHGKLIYSYDITQPGASGVEEVQISAMTGKLVSRHHESAAKEAIETKAEAMEAKVKDVR